MLNESKSSILKCNVLIYSTIMNSWHSYGWKIMSDQITQSFAFRQVYT